MHATNNNNSASAIDLTYIYTLSIVKIKSIGNQTNSPKIRKDSSNHLRKLVLINTFIERKMAVYGEILKSKRNQQQHQHQQHQQQRQQLVHQLPPLTPPPSPPMNKRFVIPPPQNVQQKMQLSPSHQPPSHQPSSQPPSSQPPSLQQQPSQPRLKKAGYSYGGGFKRVQQKQHKPFQVIQPIQIYGNQIQIVPQRTGFNSVQQPQIHWIPIQVPAHHNHQLHYGVNGYSMVQTQEQQLYLQQHVFLPPHPRGPHAPFAKMGRRPQLVRM